MRMQAVIVTTAVLAGGVGTACGATVFSESFTGQLENAVPQSGVAWSVQNGASIAAAEGNPASSLRLVDSSTSTGAQAELNMGVARFSSFDMAKPNQERVTVQFDWRVDSFESGITNGSTTRLAIKDGTGSYFVFGLGLANIADGDSAADYHFYAGGAGSNFFSNVQTQATPIGLKTGAWDAGFDLLDYNSTTRPAGSTLGRFYRIGLTFTAGSSDVLVSAMKLNATGQATAISTSQTVNAGRVYSLSNTSSAGIGVYTGGVGKGTLYVDNIVVDNTAVPEPAALGVAGLALAGATLGRRRRPQ